MEFQMGWSFHNLVGERDPSRLYNDHRTNLGQKPPNLPASNLPRCHTKSSGWEAKVPDFRGETWGSNPAMTSLKITCLLSLIVKHLLNLSNDITLAVAAKHPPSLQIIFQTPGSSKWDEVFIICPGSKILPGSTMTIVHTWDKSHRTCLLPIFRGAIQNHLAERLKFQTSEVRPGVRIPLRHLWRSRSY